MKEMPSKIPRNLIYYHSKRRKCASLMAQLVKNLPAMRETWVRSLGWEDPLEKGTAIHSSILAWRISWTAMGSQRIGHDWATFMFFHFNCVV